MRWIYRSSHSHLGWSSLYSTISSPQGHPPPWHGERNRIAFDFWTETREKPNRCQGSERKLQILKNKNKLFSEGGRARETERERDRQRQT
jgi:hypothetical protein